MNSLSDMRTCQIKREIIREGKKMRLEGLISRPFYRKFKHSVKNAKMLREDVNHTPDGRRKAVLILKDAKKLMKGEGWFGQTPIGKIAKTAETAIPAAAAVYPAYFICGKVHAERLSQIGSVFGASIERFLLGVVLFSGICWFLHKQCKKAVKWLAGRMERRYEGEKSKVDGVFEELHVRVMERIQQ